MADEQLRRDGLLGESVHLARQRAQQQGGGAPPSLGGMRRRDMGRQLMGEQSY